jgi:hypothetical protein
MIAIPKLGVQLETTRGISLSLPFLGSSNTYRIQIPLSTFKALIPLDQVSTIVIHEGLRRWRVEYYLAIIKRSGSGISVGFSVGLSKNQEVLSDCLAYSTTNCCTSGGISRA